MNNLQIYKTVAFHKKRGKSFEYVINQYKPNVPEIINLDTWENIDLLLENEEKNIPKIIESKNELEDKFGDIPSKSDQEKFKKPYVPKEEFKKEWDNSNYLKNLGSLIKNYDIKNLKGYIEIELGKSKQFGRAKDMYKITNDIYSSYGCGAKIPHGEIRKKAMMQLDKTQIQYIKRKILNGKEGNLIAVPISANLVSEKFIESRQLGIIFFKNPPIKLPENIKNFYLIESFGTILALAY